ncbi:hypothetical protein [Ornithinimicrobium pratense]|uniref:DUF4913 domain-containing protein n=1 Tax=Ornithinimicrobium pratense TaxID=2593973 RepID=A0A5J6V4V8_9MICO|nr:hypothetical protein [Ornithinimicrobium pratense]QFG68627.1 hypothetical protein FY030_07760 [Ornithinimicrobium pratense]
MGISTDTAEETPPEGIGRSWGMASVPEWGAARAGWSTYREQFADIFWFLWDDHRWDDVRGAAADLAQAITDVHGAPEESTEESASHGPSWWWRLNDHGIQIYAHNGAIRPEGFPAGPSVVQLHVDLRAVADLREAEARELDAPPRP